MSLIIYNRSNKEVLEAHPTDKVTLKRVPMSETAIDIVFLHPHNQELKAGDFFYYANDKYILESDYTPVQKGSMYEYSLVFYGLERSLKQILMQDIAKGFLRSDFVIKGNVNDHVTKLVEVMKRLGLPIKIGNVIETKQRKNINYRGVTCFDAANLIANTFGVKWWIDGGAFNMGGYDDKENFEMTYRGKVVPESNTPYLICGGEVNAAGDLILSCGSDSFARKSSTGHYVITLPDYMRGNENYSVMLTGVLTDNIVTRAGVDGKANCFWVQAWQSPGKYEDAGFTFMVYGSGNRID